MYVKAVTLAQLVDKDIAKTNQQSQMHAKYWKRTVTIPFLDVICSELKRRPSKEKRAHYELCALIPQVIISKSEEATVELAQVLQKRWGHLMSLRHLLKVNCFAG